MAHEHSYEEYNGSWYYYAKATNEVGTRYVSTPNIIIDADPAVALEYPSGKELTGKYGQTESGTYWGDLQFTVVDESKFTVKDGSTPLEPDENGVYTIKADMDEGIKHEIVIMDAGNNRTAYINEIRMNTLDRRDNPSALNLPNGANLEESLPKTVRILTARDSSMFTNIPVIWEIPETYEQASKREQSFTVNGTLDLSGTDIVLHPDKTELGKAQISVTIAGAPRYTLTIADSANGSITVVNATETAEDGKPLFFKDELVMLSIAPDEGYMLSALSVNGIPATVAVGDDTYTFAQPEENVTITATFEKRNEHTVTFDANGGSEPEDLPGEVTTAMPAKKVLHGSEYYLPECEFIAPENQQFKAWQIDGTEYPVNAPVTVTADITVKALWKDAPPAPVEYTVTVTTEGNGTASASSTSATAGTEITLTATPNEGYHFKEWQVISGNVTIKDDKFLMPDSNVEIKAIFEKDAPPTPTEYTVTVTSSGNGTASASPSKAVAGAEITLSATPDKGYHLKEWQVESPTGLVITNNKFTMPDSNVEVKAIFEEDAPPAPTNPAKPSISVTGTYTYNGFEHTATVSGYDPATMDISGNTATDAGDYIVSVTSKTGKWADGSTEAVTAEWSIGKATQEAPIGLIGVAPSTEDGSDGKITGVTDKMEYRMAGESTYTACSGTEIENLSAGNYFVRYAEDNNHFAGTDAEVTVGKGAPLADCAITFDGNGGSGSMGPVTVKAGANYILPECGFTAPADQEFKAWEISGTEYKVGDSYTVLGDTEIKALWENSVITPTTYTVTVSNDGNGTGTATPSTAVAGTTIILTATPNTGYHFKEWQVMSGNVTIKDDKFTMPNAHVEVKAIFEEDVPAPTEFIVAFDGNGGTPSVGSMTTTNQKLSSLPSASRSGRYSFDGWYTEKSGGTKITKDTVFHADTTVYAHWTYTGGGSSGYSYEMKSIWSRNDLSDTSILKLSTATGYIYGYVQDLESGMWQYIILDFATGETVFTMDVSNKYGYNNMAIGMYAGNSGNALYCPTGYLELLCLQDRFVYLPEMPYRKVDLDKAARNVLTQEQFEQDGGDGTVASWRNTVTVENVHPNTTVSFRMNNLSGSAADLKLYAYGADGKLAEVGKELWSITDETGAAVDTLSDGTLYELRVSVADGGAFDLSETEKEIKISVVLVK